MMPNGREPRLYEEERAPPPRLPTIARETIDSACLPAVPPLDLYRVLPIRYDDIRDADRPKVTS